MIYIIFIVLLSLSIIGCTKLEDGKYVVDTNLSRVFGTDNTKSVNTKNVLAESKMYAATNVPFASSYMLISHDRIIVHHESVEGMANPPHIVLEIYKITNKTDNSIMGKKILQSVKYNPQKYQYETFGMTRKHYIPVKNQKDITISILKTDLADVLSSKDIMIDYRDEMPKYIELSEEKMPTVNKDGFLTSTIKMHEELLTMELK